LTWRLTVEGARPSGAAIERIELPATRPQHVKKLKKRKKKEEKEATPKGKKRHPHLINGKEATPTSHQRERSDTHISSTRKKRHPHLIK